MFPQAISLWIVRACVAGVLLLGCYFWGRGNGVEVERARNSAALTVCMADRAAMAVSLDEVNASAAAARAAEKEQAARADQAEQGAKGDAKVYQQRLDAIAADLAKAKRTPTCRAQLELPLCAEMQ